MNILVTQEIPGYWKVDNCILSDLSALYLSLKNEFNASKKDLMDDWSCVGKKRDWQDIYLKNEYNIPANLTTQLSIGFTMQSTMAKPIPNPKQIVAAFWNWVGFLLLQYIAQLLYGQVFKTLPTSHPL